MDGRAPRIGITGPDRGGTAAWWFCALAIWRAGGRPCRITPSNLCDPEGLDGLIVGGGADVDPGLYGETLLFEEVEAAARREPTWLRRQFARLFYPMLFVLRGLLSRPARPLSWRGRLLDQERDELELFLLDNALRRGLPILGICRGEQLLNVALGGRLIQDVRFFAEQTPHIRTILPRKVVEVLPGTILADIVGPGTHFVNAQHEQAVCCLGKGLAVAARERSGIIQAVEHKKRPFVLGVQWHPEFLPHMPRQRALFRALVHAAKGRRAGFTEETPS